MPEETKWSSRLSLILIQFFLAITILTNPFVLKSLKFSVCVCDRGGYVLYFIKTFNSPMLIVNLEGTW